MNSRYLYLAASLLSVLLPVAIRAQVPATNPSIYSGQPAASRGGVYVYIERTPAHVRLSTSSVFQQLAQSIMEDLAAQHVAVAKVEENDPGLAATENVKIVNGDVVVDVLANAKRVGASQVLVFLVDRPMMYWVKVTITCRDLSGDLLWQDTITCDKATLTGSGGLRHVQQEMKKRLAERMGQPGMLAASAVATPAAVSAAPAMPAGPVALMPVPADTSDAFPVNLGPAVPQEGLTLTWPAALVEPAPAALAAGTAVRLVLVESVNSATAKVGDAVQLRVLKDVKEGDLVVIARKAEALGVIAAIQPPKRGVRPGSITVRLQSVLLVTGEAANLVGEQTIKSRNANASAKLDSQMKDFAGTYGGLLFIPFLYFQHGEAVVLPAGMEFPAMLKDPVAVRWEDAWLWQPIPEEKSQGDPVIVAYQVGSPAGSWAALYCGEAKLADMVSGTSYRFTLPPGKYWFRSDDKKQLVPLLLEDGGTYYLRVDHLMTGSLGGSLLRLRDRDIGEVEVANTVPLNAKNLKDIATIDATLLSAKPK